MTLTITISLANYLFSLNIFITLRQDKEKGNRAFVPLINDSSRSLRPHPPIHILSLMPRYPRISVDMYFYHFYRAEIASHLLKEKNIYELSAKYSGAHWG